MKDGCVVMKKSGLGVLGPIFRLQIRNVVMATLKQSSSVVKIYIFLWFDESNSKYCNTRKNCTIYCKFVIYIMKKKMTENKLNKYLKTKLICLCCNE